MRYLLLYLPFCLVLAPSQPNDPAARPTEQADDVRMPPEWTALLATSPLAPFPATPPLVGLFYLARCEEPDPACLERLAKEDPVAFLEACLRRYHKTVHGYRCTMSKQERIDGDLKKPETVEVCFQEKPFSVFLRWHEGARLIERALWVKGQNTDAKTGKDMVLVRPKIGGSLLTPRRDPEGPEARQSGRYTLKEFGLRKGLERVLDSWYEARKNGDLRVTYLGEQKLPQAGDRPCYVFRRERYAKPEFDGVMELTIWIDKETLLQVGSVLLDKDGGLIAEYYFRDVQLNPEFKAEQFTDKAMKN